MFSVLEEFSLKSTLDPLRIKNTNTKDSINVTIPIVKVVTSWVFEGLKKIRAEIDCQVDSVHVEYLPDFQS